MRSPDTNRPTTKAIGSLLVLIGAGLALFALLADRIEFGGGEGFGYQQLIVLIVGIVLILGGIRVLAHPYLNRMNGHGAQDFAEVER